MPATIALTGGTGFIGSMVGRRLRAAGYRVHALRRPGREERVLPDVASAWVDGDLEDEDSLAPLVRGAEILVHCAGAVRGRTLRDFERVNADGTVRLLRAANRSGQVSRVLFLSSLAAREPGLSAYAASKRRQERAVAETAGGIHWTALRPPAVYGPGDREMLPLFRCLRRGFAPTLGGPGARFSLLFVEDLARAVEHCLRADTPGGAVYELHDGRSGGYSWGDVSRIAEASFGRRVIRLPVPLWLLLGAAGLNTLLSRLLGYAPMLTPGKTRELTHPDWVCDNAAIFAATGWEPTVELSAGLCETLTVFP